MSLFEQYRPRSWGDVVGQDAAVASLCRLAERDALTGRAYCLAGPSGSGKSTIAGLLAATVADDLFVRDLDAGLLTMAKLADLEESSRFLGSWGSTKTGRVYVVNEAHRLTAAVLGQLLVTLDTGRIPGHVAWIFTTTVHGRAKLAGSADGSAFLSRLFPVPWNDDESAWNMAAAARVQAIAHAEGLDGQPLAVYVRALEAADGNMRAVLQLVEAGQLAASARAEIVRELQRPLAEQAPNRRARLQAQLAELGG